MSELQPTPNNLDKGQLQTILLHLDDLINGTMRSSKEQATLSRSLELLKYDAQQVNNLTDLKYLETGLTSIYKQITGISTVATLFYPGTNTRSVEYLQLRMQQIHDRFVQAQRKAGVASISNNNKTTLK